MNRRAMAALALVAGLSSPSAAQGPSSGRIEMPGGGAVPTTLVQDRARQPWKVWVAAEGEGFRPRARVGDFAPFLNGARAPFMEPCFFVHEHVDPKGGPSFLLLAKADGPRFGSHVGWVNKAHVVMEPRARRSLKTRNYEKVLIVHTAEELKRAGTSADDDVPAMSAPGGPGARNLATFQLQNIFFAYARTATHVLIGSAQSFVDRGNPERSAVKVVQGWVPLDRVIQWDSREGILWDRESTLRGTNPRREPKGRTYLDAGSASRDLRKTKAEAEKIDPEVKMSYLEQPETVAGLEVSTTWPKERPRPPLLEWRSMPGVTAVDPTTRNRLLRVGWIGDFVSKDDPSKKITQEQIEERNRKLGRYRDQIRVKELLFVIDDTLSMKKWFGTVAATVERIVDAERAAMDRRAVDEGDVRRPPELKVAIAYYADEGQPAVVQALSGVESVIRDRVRQLAAHPPRQGGAGTRGMVFDGVLRAIEAANFSQVASKMVVVIGDMGDRSDPVAPAHPGEAAIVSRLLPKERLHTPIEFCAIHVQDPGSHEDAGAFKDQMQTIQRLLAEKGREYVEAGQELGTYLPPPARLPREDDATYDRRVAARAQASLDGRYQAFVRYMREQLGVAEQAQQGRRTTDRGNNSLVAPALQALIGDVNLEGKQICQESFVWVQAPARDLAWVGKPTAYRPRQVRSQFMLAHADIVLIIRVVSAFLDAKPDDPATDLRAAARDLLLKFRGEEDEGKSINFLLEAEGLEFKSPLLTKAINQIDVPLARQEVPRIQNRLARLIDARDHKQRTWRRVASRDASGEEIERFEATGIPTTLDRSFRIPGSNVSWYWIDEEELP